MDEIDDLRRLPPEKLESPETPIAELKPGQQAVLGVITDLRADEAGHLWVKMSGKARASSVVAGMTVRAERTQKGFIVWLDKQVTFMHCQLSDPKQYLPVVEFREAQHEE